jgi:hypothetical protein
MGCRFQAMPAICYWPTPPSIGTLGFEIGRLPSELARSVPYCDHRGPPCACRCRQRRRSLRTAFAAARSVTIGRRASKVAKARIHGCPLSSDSDTLTECVTKTCKPKTTQAGRPTSSPLTALSGRNRPSTNPAGTRHGSATCDALNDRSTPYEPLGIANLALAPNIPKRSVVSAGNSDADAPSRREPCWPALANRPTTAY